MSQNSRNVVVLHRRGTYEEWLYRNPVICEGELIVVTNLPWYRSWFGLKPIRLKYGTNRTFKETKFI